MRLTLLLLDEPTDCWAAMFTSNAFPGAFSTHTLERTALTLFEALDANWKNESSSWFDLPVPVGIRIMDMVAAGSFE